MIYQEENKVIILSTPKYLVTRLCLASDRAQSEPKHIKKKIDNKVKQSSIVSGVAVTWVPAGRSIPTKEWYLHPQFLNTTVEHQTRRFTQDCGARAVRHRSHTFWSSPSHFLKVKTVVFKNNFTKLPVVDTITYRTDKKLGTFRLSIFYSRFS